NQILQSAVPTLFETDQPPRAGLSVLEQTNLQCDLAVLADGSQVWVLSRKLRDRCREVNVVGVAFADNDGHRRRPKVRIQKKLSVGPLLLSQFRPVSETVR